MIFHIITLFPESFDSFFKTSIIGKAKQKWLFEVHLYKLFDFSDKKFGQVDDKAYGMHGQVIRPEPLAAAIEHIFKKVQKKIPVYFFSPSWQTLTQPLLENIYEKEQEIVLICGHYEGIDQRIIDIYVDKKISIGDYVLSWWELAAQVFIDAVTRQIPQVLGNPDSLSEESFSKKLDRKKEYPVYTRPAIFAGKKVPEVLISGHHANIEKWKKENLW